MAGKPGMKRKITIPAHDIPVINANPDNLTDILRNILNNTDSLPVVGKSSSDYVAAYHDSNNIVEQLKHIYNTIHY